MAERDCPSCNAVCGNRMHPDYEKPCCNPDCNGLWGTGCWHCHHPRFYDNPGRIQIRNHYERSVKTIVGTAVVPLGLLISLIEEQTGKCPRGRISWKILDDNEGIEVEWEHAEEEKHNAR